jgi:arylsulfate sulfotransferase
MPSLFKLSVISFLFTLLTFSNVIAQPVNTELFEYLSPVPGASLVKPAASIIIKYKETLSPEIYKYESNFSVTGDVSGIHRGKLKYLKDENILTFKPFTPFSDGENVTVEIKPAIKLMNGDNLPYLKYNFRIAEREVAKGTDIISSLKKDLRSKNVKKFNPAIKSDMEQDSLPADFPSITIDNLLNPTDGYIFFTPFVAPTFSPTYLIITDNYGVPVFYRKTGDLNFDFKKQPNGNLSYYDLPLRCFYIMDNRYEIIDTLTMQNGYSADLHELRILDNGHALMMAYDPEPVRMDTVVPGGNPNAIVTGLIIQEQDENDNVVFQWRSWDHFKITDATDDISLTDSLIDCVHGNAIEVDYDGNLLLSSRHLDEITKIDRTTGNIIWRWGGIHCKNNQFTFINDSIGFSHQHHIRRLPNGNYTIFDNGNLHAPQHSRALEYQLDQTNKIAILTWKYVNDPFTYSFAMGSVQRLPDHHTFIGWGATATADISEVSVDGTNQLELSFSDTLYSYRAFKFPWQSGAFTSDQNNLDFGVVPPGDSSIITFSLTNNLNQDVEINSTLNRDSAFTFLTELPVRILPNDTAEFSIKFSPDTAGLYNGHMYLRWDSPGQRITKIIGLKGYTDSIYVGVSNDTRPEGFSISQNYPNPFNPTSRINYSIPRTSAVKIQIFDILGNLITTLVNKEQPAGSYVVEFDGSRLASGIYFYRFNAGEFLSVKKMLLLK